ncbi:MAG: hypothetical protein H6865_02775 [Rhodospirillales bacterium]|nr:hypothetical protein [Alphaproteobacteria bacterium]MCB9986540.1 hypothetical protein [Rhodospirillales bacterium]USO06924.1 MAG: hypothetical protein H6866_05610 [Rhodospirillales bacterium]
MKISISNLGHQTSALIDSVLYARTRSAARIRVFGVAVGVGALVALNTTDALASSANLSSYAKDASGKTNVTVDILTYIAYIGGAILSGLGIMDLKKHVEDPSQKPMKNGIAKLGFGGMLLALPYFTAVMQGTTGGENAGAAAIKNWGSKPTVGG